MRSFLRAMFAVVLLLGGLGGDWAPAAATAAHACCCGTPASLPAGMEDGCPCPKPEGSRTPRGACTERQAPTVQVVQREAEQGQRRSEPRPEPATWARPAADLGGSHAFSAASRGRDPDLGRHLAHLSTFRI
ncbi:MAG: hypothetical protein U0P46_09645 [Holophagaceae bacterium]